MIMTPRPSRRAAFIAMGFKINTSFLKYLTMGASATQRVAGLMHEAGLRPVELERYACTNKIWATKVKRLRLPDLLCLRTGIRVEVRGKSKLELRMSDAPNNKQRRWHTGLQGSDLVAFVKCEASDALVTTAESAEFFWVADLRRSYSHAKLGNRKSASEGAEQDVCWPATVASSDGKVLRVTKSQLQVELESGRRQTYQLGAKTSYVAVGDSFRAGAEFLAGVPRRKAMLPIPTATRWDPRTPLRTAIDRYVCAKALGHIGSSRDFSLLRGLQNDRDHRVALESTASLAKLGHGSALRGLAATIESPMLPYLRMEAVFILAEIQGELASECSAMLEHVAREADFDDEVRQAAIWYLGFKGQQRYTRLHQFLDAPTENQRLHAIAAFGTELPASACKHLVGVISSNSSSERAKSGAAEILARQSKSERVIAQLLPLVGDRTAGPRALSILGSMDAEQVAAQVVSKTVLKALLPVQLASKSRNWTRAPAAAESLSFLYKQAL